MNENFWQMGGYALYVWGSFGAAAVIYFWNWFAPRARRKEILKQLAQGE